MNILTHKMCTAYLANLGFRCRGISRGIEVRVPSYDPRTGKWSEAWHKCYDFPSVRRAIGYDDTEN